MQTDHTALIEALERAEGPSYALFRRAFDAVFPEPPQPRPWTWQWFVGDTPYQRWLRAELHFDRLAGRKQWRELAVWLGAYTDREACKLLAAALRAKAGAK